MRLTVVRLKRTSRRSEGSQAPAALCSLEPFIVQSPWCANAGAFGLSALLPSYVGNQVPASAIKRQIANCLRNVLAKALPLAAFAVSTEFPLLARSLRNHQLPTVSAT